MLHKKIDTQAKLKLAILAHPTEVYHSGYELDKSFFTF